MVFTDSRTALAFTITLFSILSITGTSIVYLQTSSDKDRAAERIFSATLPLYGTWIGTLLAYYFAKENFDSGAQNTKEIFRISRPNQSKNLESILVAAAISNRFLFETDLAKSLKDIKSILIRNDRKRLPILDQADHTLKFLAYYEDLDAYDVNNPNKSLSDFIQNSSDKNKPVVFVSKEITLARANEDRKRVVDCRDIFVTENGAKDGKVIGYLSDFDIDRYSRDQENNMVMIIKINHCVTFVVNQLRANINQFPLNSETTIETFLDNNQGYNMVAKIYLHWTATGYGWVQKDHYHTIITGDGQIHRLHDYTQDLYSHTYMRNSNSIGISCACMGGIPDPWTMPPTDVQVEAMCQEVARVAKEWGWKEDNINIQHIMTHAEAASNRDGWNAHDNYGPQEWGGTGERWDFMQLSEGGASDAGNVLRKKILGYYRGAPDTSKPFEFVKDQTIEANGQSLSTSIDESGLTWAKVADLLSIYDLPYQWDSTKRRILIGASDVSPSYLDNKVRSDIGYPLFEMSLQGSNSPIILIGILRSGKAYCRVLEFAEEFGITKSFNPFKLGTRRGGQI